MVMSSSVLVASRKEICQPNTTIEERPKGKNRKEIYSNMKWNGKSTWNLEHGKENSWKRLTSGKFK